MKNEIIKDLKKLIYGNSIYYKKEYIHASEIEKVIYKYGKG